MTNCIGKNITAKQVMLFLALFLLPVWKANACSCKPPPKDYEAHVIDSFNSADAVVLAKASAVMLDPAEKKTETQISTFTTIKSWKGDHGTQFKTRIITMCCMCGFVFEAGETYLLYLHKYKDSHYYDTSVCTLTKKADKETVDIKILDKLSTSNTQ